MDNRYLPLKTLSVLCLLAFFANGNAFGQQWVKAMFEQTSHDFGNVPRGAKSEFSFKLSNKYEEDVHIASVRSSCGCTIPSIEKQDLKTYEEGAIICKFNTTSFIGAKSAVVTVVFDRPYYGEMQLMVKGNIRSDIVTEPGQIQFGELERGQSKDTTVKVTYAGTNAWEITDVRSANQNLAVKLNRVANGAGKIEYQMQVRLKDSAPAGDFSDQIVLVTNDPQYNLVTIPVKGNIVPPLVMPASVELGTIQVSTPVTKRLVIKSKTPFAITKIECGDSRFSFTAPEGKKPVHIIPMQFVADETKPGAFKQKVVVYTTLDDEGTATTMVSGNVTK